MKLRDIRNPGWFWAQNELFDVFLPLIGANGVVVYLAICRMLDDKRWKHGRLSLREVAEMAGVSKDTVARSRILMVALGMIAEKATGTTSRSTFELLDLRAAAEVGPEELQRRFTLSQNCELPSETVARFRGATVFCDSCETVSASQSELFKTETNTRERENARESKPLDLVGLAGLIVLAHPRAKLRNWTERDVLYADRMAAIEAAKAEAELVAGAAEDAAVMILNKIERIAREVPRDQWRFLKEIDKFLRLREYRMEPTDLYRQSPNHGGNDVHRTKQDRQHPSAGAEQSAPARRGTNSRANIAAALERRLRERVGTPDGGDAGEVPQSGAAGGDAGHVSGGLGEDGGPPRAA